MLQAFTIGASHDWNNIPQDTVHIKTVKNSKGKLTVERIHLIGLIVVITFLNRVSTLSINIQPVQVPPHDGRENFN